MRTLSGPTTGALAAGEVAIVQLISLAFSTTPLYLNTSTWDLVWDGITYQGANGLGTISAITDKPGEVQGLTLELAAGDSARVSLALDDADIVQGTVITIRTAIIDISTTVSLPNTWASSAWAFFAWGAQQSAVNNFVVVEAPVDWIGTLDTMSIGEDGESAVISCTAESKAVDILRGTVMHYSDADQRTVNADDGAFKYVNDQIDKPIVWPTRAFFYQ